MDSQQGWKVVSHCKKTKNEPSKKKIAEQPPTPTIVASTPGAGGGVNVNLPYKLVLWCHDIHSKDWSLAGYSKLCTLTNASDFWKLFNNLEKLGSKVNNFFLMKDGTDPTWEHENNRDGGICSFRTDIDHALKIYEDLCCRMVCGELCNDIDDVNGISLSPKNNWAIIKIWNKDSRNDLSVTLNPYILYTYRDLSIKYKKNEPEY